MEAFEGFDLKWMGDTDGKRVNWYGCGRVYSCGYRQRYGLYNRCVTTMLQLFERNRVYTCRQAGQDGIWSTGEGLENQRGGEWGSKCRPCQSAKPDNQEMYFSY